MHARQRQRFGQSRHERLPLRLVQAIAHRLPEEIVTLLGERRSEEGSSLQVVNSIDAADCARKRCASDMRGQLRMRRNYDYSNLRRPFESRRSHTAILANTTRREAPVQSRGYVIRVSFKLSGVLLDHLVR